MNLLEEITNILKDFEKNNKGLRKGQYLYNELYFLFPDIVKNVDICYDPFYNDNNIPMFILLFISECEKINKQQ